MVLLHLWNKRMDISKPESITLPLTSPQNASPVRRTILESLIYKVIIHKVAKSNVRRGWRSLSSVDHHPKFHPMPPGSRANQAR